MELTAQHKKALMAAGIDWKSLLQKVKNILPLLIAIAETFLNDGNPPVMKAAPVGCTLKEQLQCALHQQICASHQLCEAICNCDDSDI